MVWRYPVQKLAKSRHLRLSPHLLSVTLYLFVTLEAGIAGASSPPPNGRQNFSNYVSAAPFPNVIDPVDQSSVPVGWSHADEHNLRPKASFYFSSAGRSSLFPSARSSCAACVITSRAELDEHFEHNQINGTAGKNVGGGKDTNGAFFSVFRTFPVGDPHDTTIVAPDGLILRAYCSGDGGTKCIGAGNIVSGIVRPETGIVPGDVIETCYKSPRGSASWLTNWVTDGYMGAAGSHPRFYGAPTNGPYRSTNYLEYDSPDGFALNDLVSPSATSAQKDYRGTPQFDLTTAPVANVSVGKTSASQNIRIQGAPFATPTLVFAANSGDFVYTGSGFASHTRFDRSAAPHCYQTELQAATYADKAHLKVAQSGHVIEYVDGVEYQDVIDNWDSGPEVSWTGIPDGVVDARSSIMVALQYGPKFRPNADASMTPKSVAADIATIYSIRVWHRIGGVHTPPTLLNAVSRMASH